MSIPRRTLVRSLGVGVLGASALAACARDGRGSGADPAASAPTQGSLAEREPSDPLRIAAVTTSLGPVGRLRRQITAALAEGLREINHDGGVFGRDVELLEPHVVTEDDEDLGTIAQRLAEAGASAVVVAVDDALLIEHLGAIAGTGMAILSPSSSSTRVRTDTEGADAGLLVRLAPTQEAVARSLVDLALAEDHGDRGGAPGTIACVGPDDEAATDLLEQMRSQGRPRGARIVLERTHPADAPGDPAQRAREIAEAEPALLVLTGGKETGPLLAALRDEIADGNGRPSLDVTVRLVDPTAPDHADEGLPKGALGTAQALQGGGDVAENFRLMMINRDPSLLEQGRGGLAGATQTFDAIALICLAAQQALSLEGPAIAGAIPDVLGGGTACAGLEECSAQLRDSLASGESGSIALSPASGELSLGETGDLVACTLRTFEYAEDGAIEAPGTINVDLRD